jgi:hypothetical protein
LLCVFAVVKGCVHRRWKRRVRCSRWCCGEDFPG